MMLRGEEEDEHPRKASFESNELKDINGTFNFLCFGLDGGLIINFRI